MTRFWIAMVPLACAWMGCEREVELRPATERDGKQAPAVETPSAKPRTSDPWASITHAVARMDATKGSEAKGTVRFSQTAGGVQVEVDLTGLEPKSEHGFHVHEYGDCTAEDGKSAGEHFTGSHADHGLPPAKARHAGDMGNLVADDKGEIHFKGTFDLMAVGKEGNPILGRAVILHAAKDDGGQPTGNAGDRIACGVIGIAKSPGAT
jgi:Cu-Zn family superoxide dismutase